MDGLGPGSTHTELFGKEAGGPGAVAGKEEKVGLAFHRQRFIYSSSNGVCSTILNCCAASNMETVVIKMLIVSLTLFLILYGAKVAF